MLYTVKNIKLWLENGVVLNKNNTCNQNIDAAVKTSGLTSGIKKRYSFVQSINYKHPRAPLIRTIWTERNSDYRKFGLINPLLNVTNLKIMLRTYVTNLYSSIYGIVLPLIVSNKPVQQYRFQLTLQNLYRAITEKKPMYCRKQN